MRDLLSAEYHKYVNDDEIFSAVLSGQEWLIISALIAELFENKYSARWGIKFLYDEINERNKIDKLKIKGLINSSGETILEIAQLSVAVLISWHYTYKTSNGNVFGHNKSDEVSCCTMHVCFQITENFIRYLLTTAKQPWLPEYSDKTLFLAVTAAKMHLVSYSTNTSKVSNWFSRLTWKAPDDPLIRFWLGTASSGIGLNSPAPRSGPINKSFALEQLNLALMLEPLFNDSENFFLTRASAHSANDYTGLSWEKELRYPYWLTDEWEQKRLTSIDLKDFYKFAILDYEKAAQVNTNNIFTQRELGTLYAWANGDFQKALEHFNLVIRIWELGAQKDANGSSVNCYYSCLISSGNLLQKQGEYSAAAANFAKAKIFLPKHSYWLCDTNGWGQLRFAKMVGRWLAHAKFMHGEVISSLEEYNEILTDSPVNGELIKSYYGETALCLRGRAEVKKSLGNAKGAAEDIHAALWLDKVDLLHSQGKYIENDGIMRSEHFQQNL